MIDVRHGDIGPRVVLVQIALSTRSPQAVLKVDGRYGNATAEAVRKLQAQLGRKQNGVVGAEEWKAMMERMPFKTFDHADVDETMVAIMQGKSEEEILRDGHQYGIIAMGEISYSSQLPVASVGVGASNGVGQLVARVVAAGQDRKIGLLRIFGHGAKGQQMVSAGRGGQIGGAGEHAAALTPSVTRRMKADLRRVANVMLPCGSAELHGCRVADGPIGRLLLKDLADEWGVPVTAGLQKQHVGGGKSFRFEGPTVTVYPAKGTLQTWSEKMAMRYSFSRA